MKLLSHVFSALCAAFLIVSCASQPQLIDPQEFVGQTDMGAGLYTLKSSEITMQVTNYDGRRRNENRMSGKNVNGNCAYARRRRNG